jgi:hypothetical protein
MGVYPLGGGPSPRIPPYYRTKRQFGGDNTLDNAKKIFGKKLSFCIYLLKTIIMNRSFSKIRHIQEANTKLEKRVVIEQQSNEKKETFTKFFPESSATNIGNCPTTILQDLVEMPFEITSSDKNPEYVIIHTPMGFCASKKAEFIG